MDMTQLVAMALEQWLGNIFLMKQEEKFLKLKKICQMKQNLNCQKHKKENISQKKIKEKFQKLEKICQMKLKEKCQKHTKEFISLKKQREKTLKHIEEIRQLKANIGNAQKKLKDIFQKHIKENIIQKKPKEKYLKHTKDAKLGTKDDICLKRRREKMSEAHKKRSEERRVGKECRARWARSR